MRARPVGRAAVIGTRHRSLGRRTRTRLTACAALLLALALLTGACGGQSGGTTKDAGSSASTYANEQFHFSITYKDQLTQGEPGGGGGRVFDISFVDTVGAVTGGRYLDGVRVSVYESPRDVKASEVPGLEGEVHETVDGLLESLSSVKVTEPLAKTSVNGTPGYTVSYTSLRDGVPVTAGSTFLFSGRYQYEVTAQADSERWQALQPMLQAATGSFTVL